jgi:hypothetical protein
MLLTTAEGLVSFEEIQEHLDQEAERRQLARREIIDAAAASTDLTPEDVRKIVGRVQAMMRSSPFGPTAIVTTNDMAFGMARMFAILCELRGGPAVEVFHSVSEGRSWLVSASPQ